MVSKDVIAECAWLLGLIKRASGVKVNYNIFRQIRADERKVRQDKD